MKTYDEIFFNLGEEEIRISICKERIGYDMEESWRSISHNHSSYEFHYITEGDIDLSIQNPNINDNSWNTNTFSLAEGDICIISPNIYHNTVNNDKKGKKLSFTFDFSNNKKFEDKFDFFHGFHIFKNLPVKYHLKSLVFDTLNNIYSYGDSKRKAYLMIIFSEILRSLTSEKDMLSWNNKQYTYEVQRKNIIDEFFDLSLKENLKLDDLADKLGLSKKQAGRVLKEETGMGFQELLTEKRINYAKMLLDETELSIETIAEKVNYETCSGFIRTFKNVTGITPYKYRKEIDRERNDFKR